MKASFILAFILFGFSAHALKVVNAGNDFRNFLKDFDPSKSEQNYIRWLEFEEQYSDIYTSAIFKRSLPNWDQIKKQQLDRFFRELPSISPKMLLLFDQAEEIAKRQVARIQTQLKDFNPNITIYFLPSALTFNALVTTTSADMSHYILIIGVDGIALGNNDLDIVFSHELFHMYHFDKSGLVSEFSSSLSPLWTEGMASYFSRIKNPNKSLDAVLMDAALAQACQEPKNAQSWAQSFLRSIELPLTSEQAFQLKKEWFWQDSSTLSPRRGYCLGYLLVEKIAKKSSFEDMTRWGDLIMSEEVKKALQEMAL